MPGKVVRFPTERIAQEPALTKRELAQVLGRSMRTIQGWVNERGCPHERTPGGYLRFRLSAVEAWSEGREPYPEPEPEPVEQEPQPEPPEFPEAA